MLLVTEYRSKVCLRRSGGVGDRVAKVVRRHVACEDGRQLLVVGSDLLACARPEAGTLASLFAVTMSRETCLTKCADTALSSRTSSSSPPTHWPAVSLKLDAGAGCRATGALQL